MNILEEIIQAVEENNSINGATWSDWDSSIDIIKTYENLYQAFKESDYQNFIITALDCLIRDCGLNANVYISTLDCLEYGYTFSR